MHDSPSLMDKSGQCVSCHAHELACKCLRVVNTLQSSWRLEQVQQLAMDSRLHCQTLKNTVVKSRHDMDKAKDALNAMQGS